MSQPPKAPPILIVDDETDLRNSLEQLLKANGHEVITASSGPMALELLQKRVQDLTTPFVSAVISDWMMPDGNGLDLLAGIRRNQALRNIPFVLMSGNVTKDELMGAVRYDLDGVILKPFGVQDLIGKLTDAIAKRDRKELDLLMRK